METRRSRVPKVKTKEEDEIEINNELRALNMLEEGMSVEDRRDLLKVVRMSESTAEEERRTRSNRKKTKVTEEDEAKESELPVSFGGRSKCSSESSSREETESCPESVDVIGAVAPNSPQNFTEETVVASNDEARPVYSPDSAEVSSVSLKHDHLKDKKRNINPFFIDKESYSDSFKRRRGRMYLRFPYDLLAQGLDLESFSAQFKKYSINYAKKLENTRNKSLNSVAWSKPIIGPTFTLPHSHTKDFLGSDSVAYPSNQRYNFRGRQSKITKGDLEYIEDSSDDEIIQISQKATDSRKRKTNNCNKTTNCNSKSGMADENVIKEKSDILKIEDENKCPTESALNPHSKTAETTSVPAVTGKFFTSAQKRHSDELEINRQYPALVIVDELTSGKKLFLQENLVHSPTQDADKSLNKVALSSDSRRTSPIISTKKVPLKRTSLQGYSDDKSQASGETPPVIIVDESDNNDDLSKTKSVETAAENARVVYPPSPRTPATSPVLSLKRLPLSDVPNRSGPGSAGNKLTIERSIGHQDNSPISFQNITKRRRLDISFSRASVCDLIEEEDRAPSEPKIVPNHQDNKNQNVDSEKKVVCPICRQLFNYDIIQEHASECDQYIDEIEEVGRSMVPRTKRTRNNL